MNRNHRTHSLAIEIGRTAAGAIVALGLSATTPAIANATSPPVKQVIATHFGAGVDGTTGANTCTGSSKDTCQPAKTGAAPGAFEFPTGVAVAPNGDLYIADTINHRVQELTDAGQLVLMLGKHVNRTTGGDICTEEEITTKGVTCQAGEEGTGPGQFVNPSSIAVDPSTADIYVEEVNGRVEAFTAAGQFMWMAGRGVNKTTKGNLCTETEIMSSGAQCGAGQRSTASSEPDAFAFAQGYGDLLAVGGPGDVLYVGDERRVQELDPATGAFTDALSLTPLSAEPSSAVTALALDDSCAEHEPALTESTTPKCSEFDLEYGDLYLVYRIGGLQPGSHGAEDVIHKFTPAGVEVTGGGFPLTVEAKEADMERVESFKVESLAVDPRGRLAIGESEEGFEEAPPFTRLHRYAGALLAPASGRLVTEFTTRPGSEQENAETIRRGQRATGLAFDREGELFAALNEAHEVLTYTPVPVAELLASPVSCAEGGVMLSDETFDCALHGEVNPFGVSGTEAWFQWGRDLTLNQETLAQAAGSGSALEEVSPAPVVKGLRPNALYRYRLDGYDANDRPPESPLTSETGAFTTPFVAPSVIGTPEASFVGSSSAVLFAELNPQDALTSYGFQYGPCAEAPPCEGSPYPYSTQPVHSSAYGEIGASAEVSGLTPGRVYHYRLLAGSESLSHSQHAETPGPAGLFTTTTSSSPEAQTGGVSAITGTGATISGSVSPDGQTVGYAFEVGVDRGADTQYDIVLSGQASGAESAVSATLSGLQPGVTYAYRIAVTSGYIANAAHTLYGQPRTFTTPGSPAVLTVPAPLPQAAIPAIAFPAEAPPVITHVTVTKKTKLKKKHRRSHKTKRGSARKGKGR